jgi:hypothetical protein
MKNITWHIIVIVILAVACEEESSIVENRDLIFIHSNPINIPAYYYLDQFNDTIHVQGDSSYYHSVVDTLSNQPVLAWEAVNNELVCVGIFTEPIEVNEGMIDYNPNIWRWNSGMAAEDSNSIAYSEGSFVQIGKLVPGLMPMDTLTSGHYYWAVWGWNSSGTKILYSSRQLEFYVP